MRESFERYLEDARYQKLKENAVVIQKHVSW